MGLFSSNKSKTDVTVDSNISVSPNINVDVNALAGAQDRFTQAVSKGFEDIAGKGAAYLGGGFQTAGTAVSMGIGQAGGALSSGLRSSSREIGLAVVASALVIGMAIRGSR